MTRTAGPPPTAALAGIPAGLQAQGVWLGRRQIFVRFAAEAETATMYTADALVSEITRAAARSAFHSISVSGRDPLSNIEYICAAFEKQVAALPMMLDCDGQRPEEIRHLADIFTLVQVTLEGANLDANAERGVRTLTAAVAAKLQTGLVLAPNEQTSDSQILRIVEQVAAASPEAPIVIHPPANVPLSRDRRWITLLERGAALHRDIRLALRLPPPTGTR